MALTKEERNDFKVELKSRKIVLHKLDTAIAALNKTVSRQDAEKEKRKEQISAYKNEEELQDAYGWEFITEDEYYSLLEAMRNGMEAIDAEVSAEKIARDMLNGWRRIVASDIQSIEFELLPEAEQNRIREENYRILQEREARRKLKEEKG